MDRPILLKTARLTLRELAVADLESIHEFFSDPRVVEHSPWGPCSSEETRGWLVDKLRAQTTRTRQIYELAVTRPGESGVLGTCHLGIRDAFNREAAVGYTMRREAWGHGYATEAARALVDFAFGELKLHRLFATSSPLNLASHRVLEKAGFRREGLMQSHVLMRGRWRDSVLYGLVNPAELEA